MRKTNFLKLAIVALLGLFLLFLSVVAQDEGDGIGIPSDNGNLDDPHEPDIIWSVAWSPDGRKIAYSISPPRCNLPNNEYLVRIVDEENNVDINARTRCPITDVEWSPDSKTILIASWQEATIWQVDNGSVLGYLYASTDYADFSDHDWNLDGSKIASVSASDPLVRIWDPFNGDSGAEITSFDVNSATSVSWSPDNSKLVLGSSTIGIWDLSGILLPPTFGTPAGNLAWSPDGTKIAAEFDFSLQVVIFNAINGEILQTLEGHSDMINQVVWRPDSQAIASAGNDGSVRVWDTETGEALMMFHYPGHVYAVAWSPDGSQLVFGGSRDDGHDARIEIVEYVQP